MTGSQTPDAIPAATLVIFRPAAAGPAEILMLERARTMAFAGGALVFPGGRVDAADRALAVTLAPEDPEDAAARIAAIRETLEEAGLPIGLSPLPDARRTNIIRAALHAGTSLGEALAEAGVTLNVATLTPFARWRPDQPGIRNFDTRFYLAALPEHAPPPSADHGETTRLFWASAASVLADAEGGRGVLIYPTRRNLERLVRFADHAAAVADARAHPVRTITPTLEQRDGEPHLCIPEGLGYPVTAEAIARVRRG